MVKKKYLIPLVILLGWLIPGGSFWVIGKRVKAVLLFSLITILLAVGLLFSDFRDIKYNDNPFYYLGRFGSGLTWLVTELITGDVPQGIISLRYLEFGLLYICIAGALNVVILLSILMKESKCFEESLSEDLMIDGT